MTDKLQPSDLPHRPPFLFVDEVVEIADRRIQTRVLADSDAEFFKGHYPGQPVMPGVLLCECCFQAGALLVIHRAGDFQADMGVPVLTRIGDARFKQIVKPGDRLDVEATLDDELDGAYFMTGRIRVAGKLALRVTFVCMIAKGEDETA